MSNLNSIDEKLLLDFIRIKKSAKLECMQTVFAFIFIFSALISNLFDKAFTSSFLIGAAFLLSFDLTKKTTFQLIKIIDDLIASNPNYIQIISKLKTE